MASSVDMVSTTITLAEAVCAALLCLYTISTSRGADPIVPPADRRYASSIASAHARYHAEQAVCETASADQRDLCFSEAKATLLRTLGEAKNPETKSTQRLVP
jgi:hypothetical protein